MPDLGIQLQLLVGPTKPRAVSQFVIDSLVDVEIQNRDDARDGFQMTFTLGRETRAGDYALLRDQALETGYRVIMVVLMKGQSHILLDGIITRHQMSYGSEPGSSRLVVTGEDISLKMDLEEKRVTYPNHADSSIVTSILGHYRTLGVQPKVTPTKDQPDEKQRVPAQGGTDLSYIQMLAQRNGFIFYIEPTSVLESPCAYWGPDHRDGPAQPALTLNMGAHTNVESLSFNFDALLPTRPSVNTLDVGQRVIQAVATPQSLRKTLTNQPSEAWRITLPPAAARLNTAQAELLALTNLMETADSVTCSGELNTMRYGYVLRARRLVGVRGVGQTYDGDYYVKQVTHRLSRGKYTQSFTLAREGRGALKKTVTQGAI